MAPSRGTSNGWSSFEMPTPRLKKALGQHFLTRSEVCRPLVDFLAPDGRRVLEIGPGSGALTGALLAAGAHVTAWELDPFWAAEVRRRFGSGRLQVVVGDAAQLAWGQLPGDLLVAGNLPYNIATAVILACLESTLDRPGHLGRAAFLVQREVAERLAAVPGDGAYGSMSVLAAALARVELLGRVAPGAFKPPPRVESAFLGLVPHAALGRAEYATLKPLVRSAFAQRRKTLRNSLGAQLGIETATRLLDRLAVPSDTRAGRLDLAAFRALAATLAELSPSARAGDPS